MLQLHVASHELRYRVKELDLHSRSKQKEILQKLAFDCYIRRGSVPKELLALQKLAATARPGFKFNPNHDELGRFTFAPGGPADDDNENDNGHNGGSDNNGKPAEGNSPIRLVQEEIPPDILLGKPPVSIRPPLEDFPQDPAQPPGPGYQWEGQGPPENAGKGNWFNPDTNESLHPDMEHGAPEGPHWDYRAPDNTWWRWFPDGRMEPKFIAGGEIA